MKVKAAAKINLMLDVLGRLPDGYHSLFMIMQSVSCYDYLTVNRTTSGNIKIITDDKRIPTDEKNIAYKAAADFFLYNNIKNGSADISIEKHIPMAAGLAGGSADAAGVIFALNELYKTELSVTELCLIGEKSGADVPFSLTGGTALCVDKGGIIAPLPAIQKCWVLLCKPDMSVSTASAYKMIDEAGNIRHTDKTAMLYAMKNGDYELMCSKLNNVFEQVIDVPKRPYIKSAMREFGADAVLMSGSGPTVYGLFSSKSMAEQCEKYLKTRFTDVVLTEPVTKSVEVVEW